MRGKQEQASSGSRARYIAVLTDRASRAISDSANGGEANVRRLPAAGAIVSPGTMPDPGSGRHAASRGRYLEVRQHGPPQARIPHRRSGVTRLAQIRQRHGSDSKPQSKKVQKSSTYRFL